MRLKLIWNFKAGPSARSRWNKTGEAGWIEETKRCGEQSGEEWLREELEWERERGTKVGVGPAADRREIPKGEEAAGPRQRGRLNYRDI